MDEPSFETVEWSFDEASGVGRVVLDRPAAMNALSATLRSELAAAFDAFERLDGAAEGVAVRAVVLSGAGDRAFCAGLDLSEADGGTPGAFERYEVFALPAECPAPVVAAVDGYCVGGGFELALACDVRLASQRSEFGFPEVEMGTIPGAGGARRLYDLMGPARTFELCATGAFVSGTAAAEEGIVTDAVPADALPERVDEFVGALAARPPLAVRAAKDVVRTAGEAGVREGIRYEKRAADALLETEDHERALAADDDERPDWRGR